MTRDFFGTRILAAIFIFLGPAALACKPPTKPTKVPKSAIWVGGCDGGVWIETQKMEKSRAKLQVFDDYQGKLLKGAWFAFSVGCEVHTKADLEKTFSSYDGEVVILNKKDPSQPDLLCAMRSVK